MSRSSSTPPADYVGSLEAFLCRNPDILFIRLIWVDYFGISRGRVLTKSHCLKLAQDGKPLNASPGALDAPYVTETGRLPKPGSTHVWPCPASLRRCEFAVGHAQMTCFIEADYDGTRFDADPRHILCENILRSKATLGKDVLVGFETEFFLLDRTKTPPTPIQNGDNCWSMAGLRGPHLKLLEEITLTLEKSNVPVQQFHTENAQGFFEIAAAPKPPLEAVDDLYYTHETIKTLAEAYELLATVYPKPSDTNVFAGMHAHVSITPVTKDEEEAFLAGILQALPEISVLGMPNYDSHVRLRELSQTTGEWVAWGTEFRDVPVRKISPGHWEIRCIDGTANMYAVMGAILGAGCHGLQKRTELKLGDCRASPGCMSAEERSKLGIEEKLPCTLANGLERLEHATEGFRRAMGQTFLDKWKYSKGKEESTCSRMSETERRKVFLSIY